METSLNLSSKTYSFEWSDPVHKTKVEAEIPDLEKLGYSAWADWGPMYAFQVKPNNPLKMSYNGDEYELRQQQLRIESPMLASERERYPFYLLIEDDHKGLDLYLYLNSSHDLGKVRVVRREDGIKLFEKAYSDTSYKKVV